MISLLGDLFKSKKVADGEAALTKRLRQDTFGAFYLPLVFNAKNTTEQENISVGDHFGSKKIAANEAAFITERIRRDTFGAFDGQIRSEKHLSESLQQDIFSTIGEGIGSPSMPSKIRAHAEKHTVEQENISVVCWVPLHRHIEVSGVECEQPSQSHTPSILLVAYHGYILIHWYGNAAQETMG